MSQEFLTSFHNLNGVTIGERRRNLFFLLRSYKKDGGDLNFAHLQPRTFLEEKFRVDVLIYFKRVAELIEVLKNEKTFLVGRIFKERWFLEALCKISAKDLITDVFPNVPFKVKVKIVNKLALHLNDPNQATDYFEAIKDKYGFYLAAKLLPSCHPDFILDFLATHSFKPTQKQALVIIKRYPELTQDIFSIVMDKHEDHDFLIRHIAKCDPELFLKLNEKFKLRMRLGWRLTERFVNAHRDDVIRKPKTYYLVLHKRTIAKALNNNFRSLFVGLLPNTLEEFTNVEAYILSILKLVPCRQKPIELWLEVFQQTYGNSFWNYPAFLSLEFVKMLPLAVRHQRLSIENRPAFVNETMWVPYLPIDKSLPFLKQKLELSSAVKTREQLVNCLVLTCKLNSDTDALLDVCSFMLSKHRNDKASVHRSFLSALLSHFELEKLSQKHWGLINEFSNLSPTENDHERHAIREAYVHYLLLNSLPAKDVLVEWIRPFSDLLIIPKNSHFSRLCLLTFGEIINELDDKDYDSWGPYFIRQVINWNESHPSDNISVFQYARFEKLFLLKCSENKLDALDIQILVYRIKHSQSKRKEYFDVYLSIDYKYNNYEILNWLLHHNLPLVAAYIDKITSMILEDLSTKWLVAFFRQTRNLSHLNIPQKIVASCTVKLRESKNRNSALALSLLQDSYQFVELVREYYPTEREADYKTPEGRELYALLQVIGGCLKHLNPPSAALESILIFCKGDYLKLVRGSLYSISDSVSENKLVQFFAELITRAVSVRKHALHLTFRVLDKSEVYRIIKRFMNKEKNASLRKFIFKICFNFFVMNPEEFTWELVTLNLKAVDLDDREAIEVLLQIDQVPREYIVAYILLVWEALHNRPDPDNRWEGSKGSVLQSVSPRLISKMPNEFFENVISLYFFKRDTLTHYSSTVNAFACKYILHCNNQIEQMRRLTFCFGIVGEYVTNSWNDPSRRTSARNTTIDFLKEFCAPFLSGDYYNKEIFQAFATMWTTILKPEQTLDEYIHLKLTYFTLELDSLQTLALKLEALCDELVSTYGEVVIGILCKKINFFSRYFFKVSCKSERYSLIDSLIHDGSSIACLILAIFLLDDSNPKKNDIKERYDVIIQKLEKCHEPVIQLYLSSHIGGNTNLYYT